MPTVKLGYNNLRYNKFMAILNKKFTFFWSQMAISQHEPS